MGKKGSWFSAIKRVFTHHSKEKVVNDSEKKGTKEKKKKGLGKLKSHGEAHSFMPLFREPSSIEKIFGEFEREQQLLTFRAPTPLEQPKTPPFVPPPRAASPRPPSPRVHSPRAPSLRAASPAPVSPKVVQQRREVYYRPEPTSRTLHASATKIQSAFRGYMSRRSFRALKGLVRLQGVVRGQNVKRQTANAMKYMQMLVRVQAQIQSRRIQMLENQARYQAQFKHDNGLESTLSKFNLGHGSEAGNDDDWDDSLLTKEEIEARLHRKVEAVIKRERSMAYAYSHQLWKATPKSGQTPVRDTRAGGFPWWWNWLDRQLPAAANPSPSPNSNQYEPRVFKNFQFTPPRPYSEQRASPFPPPSTHRIGYDSVETLTPKSTKSAIVKSAKPIARTPPPSRPVLHGNHAGFPKYTRAKGINNGGDSPFGMRDDDSLTSCPPFSVPNYMAATASAKAKARTASTPKERFAGGSPINESSKRRGSFPLSQGIGSFKWTKASLFSNKDGASSKHQTFQSLGNTSVDSTVSLPAGVGVGRKPFNRFV